VLARYGVDVQDPRADPAGSGQCVASGSTGAPLAAAPGL